MGGEKDRRKSERKLSEMDTENRHYKLTSLIDGALARAEGMAVVENKGGRAGRERTESPLARERERKDERGEAR